jgi:hypothetical protein
MAAHGYGNVYNLQGGIMDWARHGQPIVAPSDETFADHASAGNALSVRF